MSQYTYNYAFLALMLGAALSLPLVSLLLARLVAPRKSNPIKNAVYECGIEARGDSWIQFKAQYYLYALVFVIFDVETVFIYPWAVAYKALGLFALIEMLIFIALLAIGLLYVWKKGILEWR